MIKSSWFKKFLNDSFPQALRNGIAFCVKMTAILLSVIVLGAVIIDYGFVLDSNEMFYISTIYNVAHYFYFALLVWRLLTDGFQIKHKRKAVTIFLGILLFLSVLPKFIHVSTSSHWLQGICQLLESKYYIVLLLSVFALLEISRWIVDFIKKNTNPALFLVTSFVVMIFFGTLLLLVPRSTMVDIRLPVVDAIFVATSAVCVTGLTPVDIATTFTPEGQLVIMMLVQIGGLGVMTITSFFAMFFMGNTGIYKQLTLKDMVGGTEKTSSLFSTLLYIIGFTLFLEIIGAVFIYWSIHGTLGMSLRDELFFSLFHAVSSFCNAGFSTLSGNLGNQAVFGVSNSFYIIISALVILGGIGFPILVNIRNVVVYQFKAFWSGFIKRKRHAHYKHLLSVNTRIVLITSCILLFLGTVCFAVLEWDGAFSGMSVPQKLTQSFFHAVVPRTAGFNSVDLTRLGFLSVVCYIFLMWIGGGSQSTAGGIKVNVLAVAWAGFVATVKGRQNVVLFNREISEHSVHRTASVIFGSVLSILIFFILLVIMEPEARPLDLLFEVVSAISTVGSSLNLTPLLGDDSKLLLSLVMFTGRVGFIYLLTSVIRQEKMKKYRLPKENIIIN